MIPTVVKYKSKDGNEFASERDAESQNFYLKVAGVLEGLSGHSYSLGYDGPMPHYEPTLKCLCARKEEVRHLFLDVDPPEPKVVQKTEIMFLRKWPHWSAWVSLLMLGGIVGYFVGH